MVVNLTPLTNRFSRVDALPSSTMYKTWLSGSGMSWHQTQQVISFMVTCVPPCPQEYHGLSVSYQCVMSSYPWVYCNLASTRGQTIPTHTKPKSLLASLSRPRTHFAGKNAGFQEPPKPRISTRLYSSSQLFGKNGSETQATLCQRYLKPHRDCEIAL